VGIGARIGGVLGAQVGAAVGTDPLGTYFGQGNPNFLSVNILQSNDLGPGIAANMTDFPTIGNTYANVKLRRKGSLAGNPPSWITEGIPTSISLQPRTVFLGASYPIGSCGCELELGRALDAVDTNKWTILQMGIDGTGLEQAYFANPSYPTGGPPMFDQLVTEIKNACVASNAHLELLVPIGGEHDSANSPDFLDWKANLSTLITRLRGIFGPFYCVTPCLSWDSQAGGSVPNIITQTQELALQMTRMGTFDTSLLGLRVDNVHYADDAGGVKGFCALGDKIANKYFALRNQTVVANPYWTATSPVSIASSAQDLGPVYVPVHQAGDVHVLILSALGNTAYATPAGWTALPSSPQHNAGNSLNARLQVWWRRAVDSNTPQPTITDLAGDDSKIACILNIRGCRPTGNPFDVDAGTTAVTSTAVSFPGLTTSVNNCLVLNIAAIRVDTSLSQFATWTPGTGLTSFDEALDFETTSGAGFGIGVGAGVMVTAGAVGATASTLNTTSDQALITVAFRP
jgi:hypothetical protein